MRRDKSRSGYNVLFLLAFARQCCRQRLDGIYRYAAKCGMRIRVVENAYSRADLKELIEFWRPDGLICSCGFGTGGFDFRSLRNIPVVYYDAPGEKDRSITVQSDSAQIGQAAAQELMRLPCRQFAYVPFFDDIYWSRERGEAFIAALKRSGASCEVFGGMRGTSAKWMLALADWLDALPKPCGVFAANDLVAEGVAIAAERTAQRIPRDVAIVGVDNHEQLCTNLPVPLTSIQVDFEQGGYLATDKLVGLIEGRCLPGGIFRYPMLKVVRRMSTRVLPTPAAAFSDRMTAFIRDNVKEGVTVEQVVKASGYSRRQAEKLFRVGCGKSILTAIHDAVYDQACMLVKNRKSSIACVADMLGGISRSQLDRIFLSRTGMTVRAWLDRE